MFTTKNSRRNFLFNTSTALLKLSLANTMIYAIGSASKNLDGSIVAGAKSCPGSEPIAVVCYTGGKIGYRCGSVYCDGASGLWKQSGPCVCSACECP